MIPFTIGKAPDNFQLMLDYLSDCEKGIEPSENWMPENSTFWLGDKLGVIGVVNIRHRLTEKLFNSGGHIGYGIRPSMRNQGYATKVLFLSLEKAIKLGKDFLVTLQNDLVEARFTDSLAINEQKILFSVLSNLETPEFEIDEEGFYGFYQEINRLEIIYSFLPLRIVSDPICTF